MSSVVVSVPPVPAVPSAAASGAVASGAVASGAVAPIAVARRSLAPALAYMTGGGLVAATSAALVIAALPADQPGVAVAGWEVALLGAWLFASGAGFVFGVQRVLRDAGPRRRRVWRVASGALVRGAIAWLLLTSVLFLLAPAFDLVGARVASITSLSADGVAAALLAHAGALLAVTGGARHGRAAGRRLTRG